MSIPTFNIGGIASGLDTNSIVSQLMQLERIPIRQIQTQRAAYQARIDAWAKISTRVTALQEKVETLDTTADWRSFITATSSNEEAVSVSASGGATPAVVSFSVTRLAASHQMSSDTTYTSATDLVGAGTFSITIDGTQHDITTTASTTVADLTRQIDDLDIGVTASTVSVDTGSVKILLAAEESGDASVFTVSGDVGTISVLEQGQDAQVTLGSGPGALVVERASNTIDDLIVGVTLTLHSTTADTVTVNVARDVDAAAAAIKAMVEELNSTLSTIDAQTKTASEETSASGPLSADATARSLKMSLRSYLSGAVSSFDSDYKTTSSIGISLTRQGSFTLDETKLRDALADDFAAVSSLFTTSTNATDTRVSPSVTREVPSGTYGVQITSVSTLPSVTGIAYIKPNPDDSFQITVGPTVVDVTVPKNALITEALTSINGALTTAGVTTLLASQGSAGGNDVIVLTSSESGSGSSFTVSANTFGLAGTFTGADITGTIDGVAGVGGKTTLTGSGTLAGLRLAITATQSEVDAAGGTLDLGEVTVSSGLGASFLWFLDSVTETGGLIDRATDRWDAQVRLADDRIEQLESRLDMREAALRRQFSALESTMAQLQGLSNQLFAGIASLGGLQQ